MNLYVKIAVMGHKKFPIFYIKMIYNGKFIFVLFRNKNIPKFNKILKVSLERCDHLLKFHNQQIIKEEKCEFENSDITIEVDDFS